MRLQGEGSIYQVGKAYRAAYHTPAGKRVVRQFKTRALALEHLQKVNNDLKSGAFVDSNKMTLGQWLFVYLEEYARPRLTPKTFESQQCLAKHFRDIANTPLQEVNNYLIQLRLNAMTAAGRMPQTVIHAKNLIFGALKQAVKIKLVQTNAAEDLSLPRVAKVDIVIFTADEIKRLINNSLDTQYGLIVEIAAVAGMRQSEILGLRVCDVSSNALTVAQTVQTCRAGRIIGQPKTATSRRKLAIPASTAARIRDHIKKNKPSDLLFTTSNGKPIAASNFTFLFNKLQVKLNIPHKKFHCLRHSHSTLLLQAGENIMNISKRLGHSRNSFTYDVYSHFVVADETKTVALIESILK